MRYKFLILFLVFGLLCNAQIRVKQLKTAESRFCQTRTSVILEKPEVRNGFFKYIAPDSICWKYDGMENIQLPQQMLAFIRQAVSGDIEMEKRTFNISWQGNKMVLVPLKSQVKRFFSSIVITFGDNGVANRVKLVEPNGDTTEIEFLKLKYTAK